MQAYANEQTPKGKPQNNDLVCSLTGGLGQPNVVWKKYKLAPLQYIFI